MTLLRTAQQGLQLVDVDSILAREVFEGHPTQCAESTGRNAQFHEAVQRLTPDALGLKVGKLTLLSLDIRVRDLVGHIRALSGQRADASHDGLHSQKVRRGIHKRATELTPHTRPSSLPRLIEGGKLRSWG
jgi:hypothetical protein